MLLSNAKWIHFKWQSFEYEFYSILKFQCHLVACSEDMEWKKSMGFQEQFFPKTSVSKFADVEMVVEVPAFSNPCVKSHMFPVHFLI